MKPSDTASMEQEMRTYREQAVLIREFREMTSEGWTVQHLAQTSSGSGGIHLWTVIYTRGNPVDLSPAALTYLAACPDPTIADEATALILAAVQK